MLQPQCSIASFLQAQNTKIMQSQQAYSKDARSNVCQPCSVTGFQATVILNYRDPKTLHLIQLGLKA